MEDLEPVVEALMNGGDTEAQVEAAIKIGQLSSRERRELAERGVIRPLISILHSRGDREEAIEAYLFALLALAFGSERCNFNTLSSLIIVFRNQAPISSIVFDRTKMALYWMAMPQYFAAKPPKSSSLQEQGSSCAVWSRTGAVESLTEPEQGSG